MCLPVCPENAIDLIGFTDLEIESMIDALAAEELAEAQLVE
jgi:heterodisulfide reductase subunit A-like polyferredoxin